MNRDHKVFSVTIEYDSMVRVQDPEAPGSGEMVNAGLVRGRRVVTVIAPDVVYVKAWVIENPHRFPNVKLCGIEDAKIDAVIELHTY